VSFSALLLDLDGVLVDSGDAVERVWREWALERGVDPDELAAAIHGIPTRQVLARFAPELGEDEVERVDARHAATGGEPLAGAAELLALELPLAVVTSCTPNEAAARLRSAALPTPSVLVTADDVEHGKPAPDPYLLAARRLGVEPEACLVVEDSPAGVAAGRAAGMTVWAVATTHPEEELRAADAIYSSTLSISERISPAASWIRAAKSRRS
jgi:mannitol-1-/sugar-/sorbitol-6-phosphatase